MGKKILSWTLATALIAMPVLAEAQNPFMKASNACTVGEVVELGGLGLVVWNGVRYVPRYGRSIVAQNRMIDLRSTFSAYDHNADEMKDAQAALREYTRENNQEGIDRVNVSMREIETERSVLLSDFFAGGSVQELTPEFRATLFSNRSRAVAATLESRASSVKGMMGGVAVLAIGSFIWFFDSTTANLISAAASTRRYSELPETLRTGLERGIEYMRLCNDAGSN